MMIMPAAASALERLGGREIENLQGRSIARHSVSP
jgi:hypothetical protein